MLETRRREVRVDEPRKEEQPSTELELFAFVSQVAKQWPLFAWTCGVSVGVVLAASLLLPKKYTATATILIQPPAGSDPRSSMAVSPVYLESLKTYEHFALSDSLFEQALERLDLRRQYAGMPVESIKKRLLQISKPRDTKVLEISATLPDRKKALDLARYIAEHTVEMNQALDKASVEDLTESGRIVLEEAQKRLEQAKATHDAYLSKEPIADLESEVGQATELRARLQRDLSDARVELAAYEARSASEQKAAYSKSDLNSTLEAIEATKAQIISLNGQLREAGATIEAKARMLEKRKHNRDLLEKELQAAQAQVEAARNRNSDIFASASFRGERLEVIDPGVLPERPSFPNIPLNVALALLASVTGTTFYLAIRFSYRRRRMLPSYSLPSES